MRMLTLVHEGLSTGGHRFIECGCCLHSSIGHTCHSFVSQSSQGMTPEPLGNPGLVTLVIPVIPNLYWE